MDMHSRYYYKFILARHITITTGFEKGATIMQEATIKKEVPIWEKSNLTIEEAAVYSGIGRNKLRELTNDENCQFVLWIGNKRLVKRRKLDEYIEKAYSI